MLDKLMRLPVIQEGAGYLCIDKDGNLGGAMPQLLGEYLDAERILDILTRGGITIFIDRFEKRDIFPSDAERFGNQKIRVAVVQEIQGTRKIIAKAGIIGPSIEAIMTYIENL